MYQFSNFFSFFQYRCLEPDVSKRLKPLDLLQSELFQNENPVSFQGDNLIEPNQFENWTRSNSNQFENDNLNGSNQLENGKIVSSSRFKNEDSITTSWRDDDLSGTFPTLKLRCKDLTW